MLAFSLELAMFVVLGYWGFQAGKTTFWKYGLAVALPLVAIVLWGIFAAPKSEQRLDTPYRLVFELALFLLAAFLLYKSGFTRLAIGFASAALLCQVLAVVWKQ